MELIRPLVLFLVPVFAALQSAFFERLDTRTRLLLLSPYLGLWLAALAALAFDGIWASLLVLAGAALVLVLGLLGATADSRSDGRSIGNGLVAAQLFLYQLGLMLGVLLMLVLGALFLWLYPATA